MDTPPQNQNRDFSELRISQTTLNSKNETLDQCGHFAVLDIEIRNGIGVKSVSENKNISKAVELVHFSLVNLKAYLVLCGGPL